VEFKKPLPEIVIAAPGLADGGVTAEIVGPGLRLSHRRTEFDGVASAKIVKARSDVVSRLGRSWTLI
jgi:hypothetical protein